jgi:ATP-dependent RNA helicase HelY
MDVRDQFLAGRGFPLDPFQFDALDALDAGNSVLVAAPTGSGKTIVAEYAIARALAEGKKTFYTTPLKALSNQKYHDLIREHGAENVGLLTGDNTVNGEAPIVVMTTEVLRNMIYERSRTLDTLRYVVLDEVHYLQDRYRGAVWEEVIIHLAPEVDLVCLSATVSNAEEFGSWIQTVRGATSVVISETRPVELTHMYAVSDRRGRGVELIPTFTPGSRDELAPNPRGLQLDAKGAVARRGRSSHGGNSKFATPARSEMVELLDDNDMLPGIMFIFSRNQCDQAVQQCIAAGIRLTTPEERVQIRRIAEAHTYALSDDDCDALGWNAWIAGLEAGFASHHAGLVPPMKEAVEEAFTTGLVKMVFATETLSLGINMPARTVAIEKLSKFTGERHEVLTPGQYTQLAGRAGRRGIDDRGFVIVEWSPFVPFEQVAGLASKRTYALTSSFRPTYNMAANLIKRYEAAEAHHLLNLSFAQFQADKAVVGLETQLAEKKKLLTQQRALMQSDPNAIAEYERLTKALEKEREAKASGVARERAMQSMRPGDIVVSGRIGGKAVVLRQLQGASGTKLVTLSAAGEQKTVGEQHFDGPVQRVGHIDLPDPYAPKSRDFKRTVVGRLRKAKISHGVERDLSREDHLRERLEAHHLHADPMIDSDLQVSAKAAQLEREISRIERRVRGRNESLARTFDRVQRVLEAWGYIDGWALTDAGQMLSRIYSESDLLIAEALRDGLFTDLEPAEVAALASCMTFESRGRDAGGVPSRYPTKRLSKRFRELEDMWRDLAANEHDAGIEQTRAPDPGFVGHAFAWVKGATLSEIIMEDDMTGGDFVRQTRQLIDVLRQIAGAAPDPAVRAAAEQAADRCNVGVIRASAMPENPSGLPGAEYEDLTIEGVTVNGEPIDEWEWHDADRTPAPRPGTGLDGPSW